MTAADAKTMTQEEIESVTRTIRDLGRAYLQANNSDNEHAQSWQDPSHVRTVCGPLVRAITAIVGEEIAKDFWSNSEIEVMVTDYIHNKTQPADIECTHCRFRYRDNDATGLCDPCDWKITFDDTVQRKPHWRS